jgi:hypothetical protein
VAGSEQYSVTSSAAVLVAAAPGSGVPQSAIPGPVGWFYLSNSSSGAIYIGGANVSSANGALVAASGTFSGFLFSGDAIYAIASSTTSAVTVLQTGA